jgi:hypothetical protein
MANGGAGGWWSCGCLLLAVVVCRFLAACELRERAECGSQASTVQKARPRDLLSLSATHGAQHFSPLRPVQSDPTMQKSQCASTRSKDHVTWTLASTSSVLLSKYLTMAGTTLVLVHGLHRYNCDAPKESTSSNTRPPLRHTYVISTFLLIFTTHWLQLHSSYE